MGSTVKVRRNHYELLGLTPAASSDDIARAFARAVGPHRPHAISDFVEITLAYETLRDPSKRPAYDASLAPPEPEPAPASSQWPRDGWPFVASAPFGPAGRAAVDTLPVPQSRADPQPSPKTPTEPQTAPFVAAPPRDPVQSDARGDGSIARHLQPDELRPPDWLAEPGFESQTADDPARRTDAEEHLLHPDDGSIAWKRPALAAGALLAGIGLLGVWMGSNAGNGVGPEGPEQGVTITLPQARAFAPATDTQPTVESPPALAASAPVAPPEPQTPIAAAVDGTTDASLPPQSAPPTDQQAEAIAAEQSLSEAIAAEPIVAQSTPAAAAPAKRPLSDAAIARTIRRIGYACGEVASTTPIEGEAAGVFKVTCTSGDSYRAAPVGGRYRFRRWGRN